MVGVEYLLPLSCPQNRYLMCSGLIEGKFECLQMQCLFRCAALYKCRTKLNLSCFYPAVVFLPGLDPRFD